MPRMAESGVRRTSNRTVFDGVTDNGAPEAMLNGAGPGRAKGRSGSKLLRRMVAAVTVLAIFGTSLTFLLFRSFLYDPGYSLDPSYLYSTHYGQLDIPQHRSLSRAARHRLGGAKRDAASQAAASGGNTSNQQPQAGAFSAVGEVDVAAAAVAAAVAAADEDPRRHRPEYIQEFLDWLGKNGMPSTSYEGSVKTDMSSGRLVLKAARDIKWGELILSVPASAVLNITAAKWSRPGGPLIDEARKRRDLSVEEAMYAFAMHEWLRADKSHWWPWIKLWPQQPDAIVYFDQKNLDEAQDFRLSDVRDDELQDVTRQYQHIFAETLTRKNKKIFPPTLYTEDLFKWVRSNLMSRFFHVADAVEQIYVPLVDFLDHKDLPTCNQDDDTIMFGWNAKTRRHEVFANEDSPADTPLSLCYNPDTNMQLLRYYGFAMPQNIWDEVTVVVTIDNTDTDTADGGGGGGGGGGENGGGGGGKGGGGGWDEEDVSMNDGEPYTMEVMVQDPRRPDFQLEKTILELCGAAEDLWTDDDAEDGGVGAQQEVPPTGMTNTWINDRRRWHENDVDAMLALYRQKRDKAANAPPAAADSEGDGGGGGGAKKAVQVTPWCVAQSLSVLDDVLKGYPTTLEQDQQLWQELTGKGGGVSQSRKNQRQDAAYRSAVAYRLNAKRILTEVKATIIKYRDLLKIPVVDVNKAKPKTGAKGSSDSKQTIDNKPPAPAAHNQPPPAPAAAAVDTSDQKASSGSGSSEGKETVKQRLEKLKMAGQVPDTHQQLQGDGKGQPEGQPKDKGQQPPAPPPAAANDGPRVAVAQR
ncbi:unnamed protein product [Vitrella brassicaformis CCMP3155]|uniref:SET domain-containing protein n=3 Tax=Vitrella brassicaformis TaxID=1169539 RepID=A0A0G4EQA9_VITBC|nr:unnamed protein product [Vitrella brassicaformis CCMP3155]|eukprot:CEL99809.1 unnamed protein product [Vitrella brassicaformis CCMP3155]